MNKKEWSERQIGAWDSREAGEVLSLRTLPKIDPKHDIPILRSREIKSEVKRFMLKWYIGTFPISPSGMPTPKQLTEELKKLAQKDQRRTKEEESRLNWVVHELVKETSRN